ncbi:uncharacterized protein RHO25_002598 [Cercospora beticola]|uniref:Uncharacterized protein n=1 Tax=Cercospora beticola TaxID=122368 RepID=A0ABZ0NEP8_CERBT|nr:hypothetical protein RHO25_002598 [Cercospora beticola]
MALDDIWTITTTGDSTIAVNARGVSRMRTTSSSTFEEQLIWRTVSPALFARGDILLRAAWHITSRLVLAQQHVT